MLLRAETKQTRDHKTTHRRRQRSTGPQDECTIHYTHACARANRVLMTVSKHLLRPALQVSRRALLCFLGAISAFLCHGAMAADRRHGQAWAAGGIFIQMLLFFSLSGARSKREEKT